MKRYFTHIHWMLLTLMIGLSSLQAVAQQTFPVVARFTQLPPYPVYLADFSNPSQTNLSIQVQQNDREIASRPFRIRIYIEGNGFLIQSTDVVQGEAPRTLAFGQVYNLTPNEVANYFKQYNLKVTPAQYSRPFNEGSFRFGVEIIDVATNRPLSGIQWATPVWITVNEPPVWVIPQASQTSMIPTTPQNITFQWAPRHTNVSDVEYEFTITEIITPQGFQGNIQNLFLSQPAFYKIRTRNLTFNHNATNLPLVPGRTYAYRVQAIAKRGREDVGVFRNNGFSEIQSFKYGESVPDLKPPTNLKLAWADNNKDANFNWKGEPEHKSFVVEVREKGQKGDWKSSTSPAQSGSVLNATLLNNLDPNKAYEARITGVDAKGRKATSSVVDLNISPIPPKIDELVLKGKVFWAYHAGENVTKKEEIIEKLVENNAIQNFIEKDSDKKYQRKTKHDKFASTTAGTDKYPLEGAIVTLYRADVELTAENFKMRERQKFAFRVTTATTDAQGEYSLNGQGLKLLSGAKFLYVVAEYKGTVFYPGLVKLNAISNNATGVITVSEITELANTIRYTPKLVVKDNKPQGDFEEISLYRLKSTIDQNKYLSKEGTLTGDRGTTFYNNNVYVKVADFGQSSTATQLFYTKPYNDKFVLRVKEKARRHVMFPVNDIEKFEEGNYTDITDYFNYTSPPNNHLVKGFVEREGKSRERLKNTQVRVFDKSVRTDDQGYYEVEIPLTMKANDTITISVVDPLNTNNKQTYKVPYQFKDETKDFLFSSAGHYIGGRIYGSDSISLSGVKVAYQGKTTTTDADGFFKIAGTGQLLQEMVKITFDGYEPLEVKADKFKLTSLEAEATDNQRKETLFKFMPPMKKPEAPKPAPSGSSFFSRFSSSLSNSFANMTQGATELGERVMFYNDNYPKLKLDLTSIYKNDSLVLVKERLYRLVTYIDKINSSGLRSQYDSITAVGATLAVDNKEQQVRRGKLVSKETDAKEIWSGGYVGKAFGKVKIKVLNKSLNANDTLYLEEDLEMSLPAKYTKDTVLLKVRLKPIMYFHGIVYDSTTFIKGVHTAEDTTMRTILGKKRRPVRLPGDPYRSLDSVAVSVNGSKVMTDADGHFKVLVPRYQSFKMEFSRNGFTTSKYTISAMMANMYSKLPDSASNRKDFYIEQQDPNVPKFETLLGFNIKVDKALKQGGDTYLLSGVLYLDKGKLDAGLRKADQVELKDLKTNIFTAGGTTELNFKDIVVKKDAKTATNAITVAKSVNFTESEAKILLFGYAPITLKGNPAGEPYIRLAHLDVKAGAVVSEGKIGASKMEFAQRTMMGIEFGRMELSVKDPDKEAKFGKFDDKISDKKGTEKEKDTKAKEARKVADDYKVAAGTIPEGAKSVVNVNAKKAEIAAKKAEAATKNDKDDAQKKEKEALEKDAKKLEKDLPKAVKAEPLLIAFAPSNLEELADSKEFSIDFPEAAKRSDTKEIALKKDENAKEDKYKDYLQFGLGGGASRLLTGTPVLSNAVMAGIDQSSATLKKSGVSMKGILILPRMWLFKDDGKPLTIEKLEIDKKFALKTAIIGKSDPDKKEIHSFGVASSWMCYINTFQIYNDFKGYGIGGTFNTDKTNYIDINSLGFSVVGGQVYPNVDLSTPKDGFKVGNLRFKTVGKKSITIKGNPADKSYEVEGSLRIEYDENAATNSKTDSTDRFGKALSPSQTYANRAKAKEEADAVVKQAGDAANREKGEKALKELIEETEFKVKVQADGIAKTEGNIRRLKNSIENFKKDLEKNPNNESAKSRIKSLEEAVKTAEQDIVRVTKFKEANLAKLQTQRANLLKVTELREGDIAAAAKKKADADKEEADKALKKQITADKEKAIAVGKSYVDTTAKKPAENVGWKERVFPIEVQLFKWSTTGKWLVSASPSQNALNFGPVNIKIRRLVFAKGVKDSPVKESEIQDLLKMTEDEIKALNSTAKFNDANTVIDKDGKRIGATSKDIIESRAGAAVDGLSIKGVEDKVAADNPMSSAWAFGFAGGIEVQTKSVNVDSDASLYVGNFDGKGVVFKLNEIMLKIDATSFRAYAKLKLGTSGKKIGFEGEGEFEGAKIKAAMSLKFYKLYDDKGNGTGIELGAALKVSMGPTGFPMGPITWSAMGGGFDLNTADKKFSIFFLGDAIVTGTSEKVTSFKKIKISLEFEGKECGAVPILKGSMEWWSSMKSIGGSEEKICDVKAEVDFCRMRVLVTMDCEMLFGESKVNVSALAFISKSAGVFLGAKVRMTLFGLNANGTFLFGILCDTKNPLAPKELAAFVPDIPKYLYQNDSRTVSGIFVGLDVAYEKKGGGAVSAFGLNLATYSYSVAIGGKFKAGVNFSNGNFEVLAATNLAVLGEANILGFQLGGELRLALMIGGGRNNEQGWHFKASAYAKLMIGAGKYHNKPCNDYKLLPDVKWCWYCATCCSGTSWKCWKTINIPYPCGVSSEFFVKLCLEGGVGVTYQQKGPPQLTGWKGYIGGGQPR